jgi:hypothetical protein
MIRRLAAYTAMTALTAYGIVRGIEEGIRIMVARAAR